jgi:hypothetical protein
MRTESVLIRDLTLCPPWCLREVHNAPDPEQQEVQADGPRNVENLEDELDGERLGELMVGGVLIDGDAEKPLGREQVNVLEASDTVGDYRNFRAGER